MQVHTPVSAARVQVSVLPVKFAALPPFAVQVIAVVPVRDTVQYVVELVIPMKPASVEVSEGVLPSLTACSKATLPGVISARAAAACERTV